MRRLSLVPILTVAAMLFVLLGIYVGGYFWLGKCVVFGPTAEISDGCVVLRRYDSQWLVTTYLPAGEFESWLRGIHVGIRNRQDVRDPIEDNLFVPLPSP